MRTALHLRQAAIVLIAASFASPLQAETGRDFPEEVVFTGWLRVEDRNVNDLVLVVEVADQCLYAAGLHQAGAPHQGSGTGHPQ